MARCIEEGDLPVLRCHLIGADVLRDSAGFLFGNARLANRIQQRRLTVIDVAHDRHDWSARSGVFGDADFDCIKHNAFFECDKLGFRVEVLSDGLCHFLIEGLVDRRKYAAIHQLSSACPWQGRPSFSARSLTVSPSVNVTLRNSRCGSGFG